MLIIEGSDHLGKTTAAKALVKQAAVDRRYPIRYAHMSRPNDTFDFLHDYQDMASKFAVQDRFHLGGIVWHKGKFTINSLKIVEGRLQALGSVCVVLHTSDEEWYRHVLTTQGKVEMFDIDTIMEANRKFKTIAEYQAWVDFIYDIKDGQFPDAGELESWLATWYNRLGYLEAPRT